jgi:hypothetical protein
MKEGFFGWGRILDGRFLTERKLLKGGLLKGGLLKGKELLRGIAEGELPKNG